MAPDIIDLCDFYHSILGETVSQDIKVLISEAWSSCHDQIILGYGYTLPFLESYDNNKNTIYSFMPAQQGILRWPSQKPTRSALVDEETLPLPDQGIDRILCIHALENCHYPSAFLKEMWRILKPEGKILFIVPNRRGLWAQSDNNPLGCSRPYTMSQLTKLLTDHSFIPVFQGRGLYRFPTSSKFLVFFNSLFKKIGPKFLQKFSGILCVEVTKKVYAVAGKTGFTQSIKVVLPEFSGQHARL